MIVDDVQRQDEPESMNGPGTPPSGEIQPPAVPPMLPPLDEPAAPQSEENSFKVPEPEHPPAEPGFAPQPPVDDSEVPAVTTPDSSPEVPSAEPPHVAVLEPPITRMEDRPRSGPPPLPAALSGPPLVRPGPGATHSLVENASSSRATEPDQREGVVLIQTRGLVKQYGGRRVVNGVDIHVRPGEVVGLLGKNGAGKTTTFYMIVGLVPPTEGHVYMGEEDVTRMPMYRRARRGIGYLPQEESIFRKLSVEDNLLAILETLPMTEEEREARCDELLRDFGLEHVRQNVAITLSGGEKRRVTIARALVTQPSLLLLDEPFSGVDPMAVHDIQEIILQLKRRGLGVLITDHNVRETLSVVDRGYIIDEGRVLSEGSSDFLINDPVAREIYLGHRFSM